MKNLLCLFSKQEKSYTILYSVVHNPFTSTHNSGTANTLLNFFQPQMIGIVNSHRKRTQPIIFYMLLPSAAGETRRWKMNHQVMEFFSQELLQPCTVEFRNLLILYRTDTSKVTSFSETEVDTVYSVKSGDDTRELLETA